MSVILERGSKARYIWFFADIALTIGPNWKTMNLLRKCAAEFIGAFAIVFAGCGAVAIDQISGGVVSHVGVAATFGLVIMVMIYATGHISGGAF